MNDKIPITDVTSDQVQYIDLYQEREKIYIRRIKGFYRSLRLYGGAFLFLLYFGVAWLDWNGRQAVLFDLPARQFHIFGLTFWPQDFILLSWALIICAFALFFITVFAGRVWCGYTCPQSVWTWVFMFIEEKVEGKRNARIKLDKQPITFNKAWRKLAKHLLWLVVAFWTALTFVGYFTPIKTLLPDLITVNSNLAAVFWIGFFTLATYGNAGWLREQVCIYMCPYARFQSVMFDSDTLIVSYDKQRGEPRGSRKRTSASEVETNKPSQLGDCIDCQLCVQVCPTGIDIRDGLQYECISCAACIDACDSVMAQMNYDPGLIRYTTENSLAGKPSRLLRPRLIGYLMAFLLMVAVFCYVIITRIPLELDVERGRGALYRITNQGLVENSYQLSVFNKSQQDQSYRLSASGPAGLTLIAPEILTVAAGGSIILPVRIVLAKEAVDGTGVPLQFMVENVNNTDHKIQTESRFFGPQP